MQYRETAVIRLKASINAGATAANIQADMKAKESLISSASWYTELKALVKLAVTLGWIVVIWLMNR